MGMGIGKKHDYPPLLAPGRHLMALAEIEHRFVLTFPNSAKRRHLFQRLEEFIQAFLIAGIACEVWVDGSFLSEKEEPVDLDVTVILDADVAATLTEQQQELMDAASEGKMGNDVDSFAFARLMLVGGDVSSRTFHIAEPQGATYIGHFAPNVVLPGEVTLGRIYEAEIDVSEIYHYATERTVKSNSLKQLTAPLAPILID
jgi:hypothetical protein